MMSHGRVFATLFSLHNRSSRFLLLSLVAISALVAACDPADQSDHAVQASNDSIYRYSAYRYQYPPSPPVMDATSLREFVQQYSHHTVVLEFWASWSPSSRSDIPTLVDLQEDTYAEGLRVIACTFDPPNEWATRIVPFLQSVRANFPCVVIPREARNEIGQWLAADWSYDLPARFVLDHNGRVAMKAFSGQSIDGIIGEARRITSSGGARIADASETMPNRPEGRDSAADSAGGHAQKTAARSTKPRVAPSTLQTRLVNVETGESESLPLVYADNSSADLLAGELAAVVADRLRHGTTQRIAIAPFAPTTRRSRPSLFGTEIASRAEEALRRKGYYDLVSPASTNRMLTDANLSALTIDYDSSMARRRLGVDFLIIGWIKGGPAESPEPESSIAVDTTGENPGGD